MVQRLFLLAIVLSALGLPATGVAQNGYYQPGIENGLQIYATSDRVFAFKPGQTRTIKLYVGEVVRSVRAFGMVGGVVTSERLLAIAAEPFEWITMSRGLSEGSAEIHISEILILFVTLQRAIAFDSILSRFVVYHLPLGEYAVAQRVDYNVAAIATLYRAVGYAAGSADFKASAFAAGEIFRRMEVSFGLISVITSDHIFLFQAYPPEWTVQSRRPIAVKPFDWSSGYCTPRTPPTRLKVCSK